VGFEPTRTRFTASCSTNLSYGHRDHGRNRTCVSGLCRPAPHRSATWSCSNVTRAAQGSNLPLPDLESGVPPLELPAQSSSQCAGRDSNPRRPMASGSTGRRNCRSATCAFVSPGKVFTAKARRTPRRGRASRGTLSQRGRVRTFDLVYPKHARYQLRYTLRIQ
jgi:hypothetical protein